MEAREAEEFVAVLDPDYISTGKLKTVPIKSTIIQPIRNYESFWKDFLRTLECLSA